MPRPSGESLVKPLVRYRPRHAALAVAAAALFSPTLHAAGVSVLPEVLVRTTRPADEKPQSATEGIVLREQIENRPWLRPAEVLETVPGLVVTQHTGDGKANQYFLRGFNLDHGTDVSLYALGLPINQRSHAHGQGYADLNFLIPELVDTLRYRKGPYAARDGDFATAGAAEIDYVNRIAAPFGELGFGKDGYRRLLGAGSLALGAGQLLIAAEAQTYDGPWTVPEDLRKTNLVLRYSEGNSDAGWRVTGLAYRGRWTATDQIPERAVLSGQIRETDSLDPSTGGETDLAALIGDAHGLNAIGPWQASAYAARYGLDLYSNFTYATNPIQGDQFRQYDQRSKFGGEFAQTLRYDALGAAQTTTAGVQLRHDRVDDLRLELTQARQVYATVRRDSVRETSVGAYVDQTSQWNEWLRTRLGLRADRFDFDVNSDRAENSGSTNASRVSPKLGVVLTPSKEWSVFANVGRGFHSNDARGTVISVDPDPRSATFGQPVDRVTPLARALGSEIGATWTVPTLQLSAALWQLKLKSELVYVGDAGATEAGRPSKRRGVEFAGVWQPGSGWTIDADATFTRPRFDDGDASAPYIEGSVRRTASLGATYAPEGPLSGALRLRHIGPRYLTEDGLIGASSTVLNAHVGYRLTKQFSIALELLNLTDKRYADMEYVYESQLPGEAAPVLDRHYHPAEGRSARVLLKYSFE
jgi:outer membrane receptor protein involved in Fe transport